MRGEMGCCLSASASRSSSISYLLGPCLCKMLASELRRLGFLLRPGQALRREIGPLLEHCHLGLGLLRSLACKSNGRAPRLSMALARQDGARLGLRSLGL